MLVDATGGITGRATPKRRVTLVMQTDREQSGADTLSFVGRIAPNIAEQRIRIDLAARRIGPAPR